MLLPPELTSCQRTLPSLPVNSTMTRHFIPLRRLAVTSLTHITPRFATVSSWLVSFVGLVLGLANITSPRATRRTRCLPCQRNRQERSYELLLMRFDRSFANSFRRDCDALHRSTTRQKTRELVHVDVDGGRRKQCEELRHDQLAGHCVTQRLTYPIRARINLSLSASFNLLRSGGPGTQGLESSRP